MKAELFLVPGTSCLYKVRIDGVVKSLMVTKIGAGWYSYRGTSIFELDGEYTTLDHNFDSLPAAVAYVEESHRAKVA
jgi:hypothetical protein